MNEDISPHPRVLIVENEEGTVKALEDDLRKAIPDAEIVSVGTSVAGQKELANAYDNHNPFDCALLDFKLPHDEDSGDEVGDVSLGFLRDLCPETLIVHMTAFPEDPDFQRFRPPPNTPSTANRLYVEKDPEKDWTNGIAKACAKHIHEARKKFHSERIRSEFENLFGGQEVSKRTYRSPGRSGTGRGERARSLEISAFCDDAGTHWNYLEESLQKLLADALGHAEDEEGNHYLGVIVENQPGTNNTEGEQP